MEEDSNSLIEKEEATVEDGLKTEEADVVMEQSQSDEDIDSQDEIKKSQPLSEVPALPESSEQGDDNGETSSVRSEAVADGELGSSVTSSVKDESEEQIEQISPSKDNSDESEIANQEVNEASEKESESCSDDEESEVTDSEAQDADA